MTVREVWAAGRHVTVTGVGYAPEGPIVQNEQPVVPNLESDVGQLLIAAGLCNDARLFPPHGESSQWTVLGDPTEAASSWLHKGDRLQEIARQTPRLRELPFDSRRKRMSTIHNPRSPGCVMRDSPLPESSQLTIREKQYAMFTAYVKGAPKEVLALCTRIRLNEQERVLDETQCRQIMVANDDYARAGLRVLAIAQRTLTASPAIGPQR